MDNQLDLFTTDNLYLNSLRATILALEERAVKDGTQLELAHETIKRINRILTGKSSNDWSPITFAVIVKNYVDNYMKPKIIKPRGYHTLNSSEFR
jgi:hypothetical protein